MLCGIEWNPMKTLRVKERVEAESGLAAKWAAAGRSYDLSTEHAFAEYAGEVFRLGLKTVSAFANAESGDAFNDVGPLADHVRGVLHNWYIENSSGDSKLIHVAWKAYLLIDIIHVYWKQANDTLRPPADRATAVGFPMADDGEPVPIMQYSQSQCWFAMNQLAVCWNSIRLDKADYIIFEALRARFALLCFLVFAGDLNVLDMAALRDVVVRRASSDGIVDIDPDGTGVLYQASESFLEKGIVFFADVAKAFHLQNSLRLLYQVVDVSGRAMRPHGLCAFQPMSTEQRQAFTAWMSEALRSPQQNQWRSDFVVHFAHALLRPALRYQYYHSSVEGPSAQLFELVQGIISAENALSIIYPGENQQAIDLFQPPRTMLDIFSAADTPMAQWVRESATLYVWGLTVSQFIGITWETMWQQLDFVSDGIPYVVHPIQRAAPYRVLRNGSTFYIYRSSEAPCRRKAYVCYDIVHALFAWASLNKGVALETFTKEQAAAMAEFFDTVFVTGKYIDTYVPEPEDAYAKQGITATSFARKV